MRGGSGDINFDETDKGEYPHVVQRDNFRVKTLNFSLSFPLIGRKTLRSSKITIQQNEFPYNESVNHMNVFFM